MVHHHLSHDNQRANERFAPDGPQDRPDPTQKIEDEIGGEFHKTAVDVPVDVFPFDLFFCGNNGAFVAKTRLYRERPDHDARRGDEGYHGSVPDGAT